MQEQNDRMAANKRHGPMMGHTTRLKSFLNSGTMDNANAEKETIGKESHLESKSSTSL